MKNLIYIFSIIWTLSINAERQVPFLDNSRFSFDLSSRISYNDRAEEATFQQFIGFDFHQFINHKGKDIGYIILQPYLYRIDNGISTPAYYDDAHDWEVIFRTLTFTFTGLGPGKPWLRIGHFELPFGLDHRKDSNGSLHQYSIAKATGLKIDWGVALGQELDNWYYELALTRGSGVKYRDRENPYALMGRLGYDSDTWSAGLSFFSGELLRAKNKVKFESIAIDFEYYFKSFGFLTEIYTGQQNDETVNGGLLEFNWLSTEQDLEVYSQFLIKDNKKLSTQSSLIFGTEYKASQNLSISAQINFSLSQFNSHERQNLFEIQFRYKF